MTWLHVKSGMSSTRVVAALVVALAVVLLPGIGRGVGASNTVGPAADAYTDASQPTKNFGSAMTLRVDASPLQRSFLKFDLSGFTGTVTSATLRVWANSGLSTSGGSVSAYSAGSNWSETGSGGITDATAPPIGAKLDTAGAITAGSWVSFNVTSGVTLGQSNTFALISTNSTALSMASNQASANKPQLILDVSGSGPPPPVCSDDATNGYTVHICINGLSQDQTLSGPTTINGSAAVTSGTPPAGTRIYLRFYLDGAELLSSFKGSASFTLPVAKWVDGTHTLAAAAWIPSLSDPDGSNSDGYVTTSSLRASIPLTFATGTTAPPTNSDSWQPTSGTQPAAGQPLTVAAVGDGAAGETNESSVVNEIAGWNPNLVLYLGDVYEHGTYAEFANYFGAPLYGRFQSIMDPTIGNHEYGNGQAGAGYFNYWQTTKHFYSFDAGGWHFISLDANSQNPGGVGAGSLEYSWLQNDLANDTAACTLAFWHQPLFNSGPEGSQTSMQTIWNLLVAHGGVTVLNGHDHDYQRFQPMADDGTSMTNGVPEIIVGSGGHGLQSPGGTPTPTPPLTLSMYGALKLSLTPTGGVGTFVDTNGTIQDRFNLACGPPPTDTTPPSTPTGLTTTGVSANSVALSWNASSDNLGVDHYQVFRGGAVIGTTAQTSYTDSSVSPSSSYSYTVEAVDAAGNVSAPSPSLTVQTPAARSLLFSDDFSTGLDHWTNLGMSTTTSDFASAPQAALAASTGAATWAWSSITSESDVYYRLRFKVESQGANNAYLLKLRTATGGSIGGVYLTSGDNVAFRNDVGSVSTTSKTLAASGIWHTLELHATIGATGTFTVWLDGSQVNGLNLDGQNLGTNTIGRIQIGDNSTGRSYSIAIDDVAVATSFI